MDQSWFELQAYRKRSMDTAAWIPLHALERIEHEGTYGYLGYREDFFGCGTVAVPVSQRPSAEKLGWNDLGISHNHKGQYSNGAYTPADTFTNWNDDELLGVNRVMVQANCGKNQGEWYVHPDLLLSLGLYREGDVWVRPDEGYVEVLRLIRGKLGNQIRLEIKAEYLKDYLCARDMGL